MSSGFNFALPSLPPMTLETAPSPAQILTPCYLPFAEAWALQQSLVEQRRQEAIPDTLLLTQHEPIITLGRTAQPEHWESNQDALRASNIEVSQIERGGSATYHGPGQLIGYPILRLRKFCPGPKMYVHHLEEVLIRTLAEWHISACRHDRHRGVWVENGGRTLAKIASIGVRIVRGITMHGFALNVNLDLQPFTLITPCGIRGCHVTSMADLLSKPIEVEAVQQTVIRKFSEVFGLPFCRSNVLD